MISFKSGETYVLPGTASSLFYDEQSWQHVASRYVDETIVARYALRCPIHSSLRLPASIFDLPVLRIAKDLYTLAARPLGGVPAPFPKP